MAAPVSWQNMQNLPMVDFVVFEDPKKKKKQVV
jgi:hypothetical protein